MTRSRGLGKTLAWTEKDERGANDEARRPDGKDSRHEAREGLELETHLRRDRRHGADVDRRRAARPDELVRPLAHKAAELFALSTRKKRCSTKSRIAGRRCRRQIR